MNVRDLCMLRGSATAEPQIRRYI